MDWRARERRFTACGVRRLIRLHPAFFEKNRPTEIQSRITTDTTLLQTVIGSSVSIALRNVLMFIGGVALLVVTDPKLSLVVFVSVPFVVAPIVLFGRRVRRLSRSSQDTLADVGAYAGESLRHVKVVQSFNHQARTKPSSMPGCTPPCASASAASASGRC